MTRDAVLATTLHTLRYQQITDDGGANVETVRYDADVRWERIGPALFATALLPIGLYVGLARAAR